VGRKVVEGIDAGVVAGSVAVDEEVAGFGAARRSSFPELIRTTATITRTSAIPPPTNSSVLLD
jgi:hypothetical protein